MIRAAVLIIALAWLIWLAIDINDECAGDFRCIVDRETPQ